MKHGNDVSNMTGCLQVVRVYSFMKEFKVYNHDSGCFLQAYGEVFEQKKFWNSLFSKNKRNNRWLSRKEKKQQQ